MVHGEITTRRALAADRAAILELCRSSLGWSPDDPDEAFFGWKHDRNAFGESPAWVAETDDGRLVGLRVFLRWRFRDGVGRALSAVRAVDTATHPEFQGRGIFSKLTLGALPDLADDGVDLVFNTPNDKSMPGYLKMGWSTVGKVPVVARPGSLRSLPRLRGARTAAELWSEPCSVGESAPKAFADVGATEALLAACRRAPGIVTDRDVAFLQWRYEFEPLHYRVLPLGNALADGVIVFRTRRRGSALEATICDVIAPPAAKVRAAVRHLASATGADYLLATATSAGPADGFVPAAGLGPTLTWKPVNRPGIPDIADLGLVLGDIELF